uniref:UDP glucuronosyltransferase 5 family, polypeptide D1 n=1 Tax=Xiphophorus couchianus TaxID=32473 RepID=A0A3B5LVN4_9TELE
HTHPHTHTHTHTIFSLFQIFFTSHCDTGNILVYPQDGSHWINMKILLEELHVKGHNIRGSTSWYIPGKSPLYTSITFYSFLFQVHREGSSLITFFKLTKKFMSFVSVGHTLWCDAASRIMENPKLIKSLIESQYDLVLTDPGIGPGVVLAKYLKLPLVLNVRWITSGEGHFVLAPSPLSYMPVIPGLSLTDKMDFIQRIQNIFSIVSYYFSRNLWWEQFMMLCGGCNIVSLLQDADIWLFRSDIVFEFPPVVYIGGFQCKSAQPLPADLEEFGQSAGEHGVIVMTLGTLVNNFPEEVVEDIASDFVIWKHRGKRPSALGNNTLMMHWMPQKDLLGHPQIKVFIAHGGTNGRSSKDYSLQGKYAETVTFTPRSADQASFWIEYVIRYKGAPHLRTEAYRILWYSYHCLDVLLFLMTCVPVFLFSSFAAFRFLFAEEDGIKN